MKLVRNPKDGARIEQLDLDPGETKAFQEKVAQDAVDRWHFLSLAGDAPVEEADVRVEAPQEATEAPESVEEAPEVAEHQEEDLEALTVPKLKERLREKGLKVSGKKAELIARLK